MSKAIQYQTQVLPATHSFAFPHHSRLSQRTCACGGTPGVDGKCEDCRAKRMSLQRSPASPATPAPAVPPIVYEVLGASGQPLDAGTRAFMEPRFGHDFSKVRVHTGPKAAESARAVNALAYTVGRDVVFGAGQYAPGTSAGKRLLTHELTHVVQQNYGANGVQTRLMVGAVDDAHEHEAERIADEVTNEGMVKASSRVMNASASVLRRQAGSACDIIPPTPHPLLYWGSRNAAVGEAQHKLNQINLATDVPFVILEEDCVFGEHTRDAALYFQKQVFPDKPEEWDGKVGDHTWAELDKASLGPTLPSPGLTPPGLIPPNQGEGVQQTGSSPGTEPPELTARLDDIVNKYRDMIKKARARGWNVGADNLERFLAGTGGTVTLSVPWLRGFSPVTNAERVNQKRFEQSLYDQRKHLQPGDKQDFHDHWARALTAYQGTELYYASGTSQITSTGDFTLQRIEDTISVLGNVTHHWFDPYDWNPGAAAYIPGFGNISDADGLLVQKYRGAKPFDMVSDWQQFVTGTINIGTLWDDANYTWTGP